MTISEQEERAFGWGGEVFFPIELPKDLLDEALTRFRTDSAHDVRMFLVEECKQRGLDHLIQGSP